MIPQEYTPLIKRLVEKTNRGELDWQKTTNPQYFSLKVGDNDIVVMKFDAWPDDETCIGLEIKNNEGERIDYFCIGENDMDIHYDEMFQLHAQARRKAMHIDETISDILSKL